MMYEIIGFDEESKEAEIKIFDENFEITVFSHPFNKNKINEYKLHLFDIKNVLRIDGKNEEIKKDNNYFSYKITGKYNINDNTISVGRLIFNTNDYIPKDMGNNDYISFECSRIDFY